MFAPGGVERASGPQSDETTSVARLAASVFAATEQVVAETTPVPAATTQVAGGATPAAGAADKGFLTQRDLDSLVTAARERWAATGLTGQQITMLRDLKFEVADLPALRLGEAGGSRIRVNKNADGNGWFVGADDAQFAANVSGNRRYTDPSSKPAGRIDLLTTIMHEMGHALGLPDSYEAKDATVSCMDT